MEDFSSRYYKLLTDDYAGINLTRITDFEEFQLKQIEDSILPLKISNIFNTDIMAADIVIDVGFGGGFPLLPLAYKLPEKKFLGVETRGKKVKVVGEIAALLSLNNVVFKHERIENILIDKKAVVTFKAVGKVHDFLSKINTTEKIRVYFYKGPNFYEIEREQIEKARKDWEIIEEVEIDVPGTEGRILIGFENKKVPHGTIRSNQLVKVSMIS